MKNEFEVINNIQIKYLNIFLVRLSYRTPHIHNEIELGIVLEGQIDLIKNKSHHIIKKNEIYIINKLEVHEIVVKTNDSLILSFQITPKIISTYFPVINSVFFSTTNINHTLTARNQNRMHSKIITIALDFFKSPANYELLCVANINLLFYQLVSELPHRILTTEEIASQSFRMKRISKITDYIEENFSQKLLLSDLAKLEHLSLTYLSHFFKDTLGMTFQAYLNARRVEYAKKLFDTTTMNILEISLESGFSDPRYMSKFFLKYFGYTTSQYKKTKISHEVSFEQHQNNQQFYSNIDSFMILETNQAITPHSKF